MGESLTPSSALDAGIEGGNASGTAEGPQPLEGLRVVVVDDDPQVRAVVALVLERAGAAVAPADSAATAFALLQVAPRDFLVSDIEMPGEDGLSFMHRIRDAGCGVAAIAMSGSMRDDLEARARDAGFKECLNKPFHPETLVALIARRHGRGHG